MKVSIFCLFLLTVNSVLAQEALIFYPKNNKLNHSTNEQYKKQNTNKKIATLSLPFIEDFYQAEIYPNSSLWEDNFAYINQTFAISPVSIGVAILDGINPVGQAYSLLANAVGDADKLTSRQIDLSGLNDTDKVLMSFFYAFETLGEIPDINIDKLRLEFVDIDGNWVKVWENAPSSANDSSAIFKQAFVKLDSIFLHANFQFRFINYGNLAGLNDIWAIDYIRIDKNRDSIIDAKVNDMAFQYPSPSLLKKYYAMPYSHFDSTHIKDSIELSIKNNFISPTTDIVDRYIAINVKNNDTLGTYNGPSRDYFPLTTNIVKYPLFSIPTNYTEDTVVIEINYSFKVSAEDSTNATITQNNHLIHQQVFSNYFAYDDGTPERGYWVEDSDNYRVAVAYNLTHPDTLRAIKMQFTPVKSDINNALFSVVVWKNVTLNSSTEQIIYKHDNLKIGDLVKEYGYDTINGYLYYNIREDFIVDNNYSFPLVLTDSFLVGLIVYNQNTLTIGFDKNNNKKGQNYFMHTRIGWATANKWFKSDFDGSLIINPIFGKALQGYITPIVNHKKYEIKVYPNPTHQYIYLSGITHNTQVDVLDLSGRVIQSFNTNIDKIINVENLQQGMYIIQAKNNITKEIGVVKFIKTNGY